MGPPGDGSPLWWCWWGSLLAWLWPTGRFDGYVTIVGMLLCALANFGGFSQVTDRLSPGGLAIQLIAIVGFLASLAGVWYGIIQRKNYTARKLKERLK